MTSNKPRPWTPDEDQILRQGAATGDTWTDISARLVDRSPSACVSRANKIGLPPPIQAVAARRQAWAADMRGRVRSR